MSPIEFPREIQIGTIEDSFKNGWVYFFKNEEHDENAPEHCHIVIETNQPEKYILIAVVTTKKWGDEAITITPADLSWLRHESHINLRGGVQFLTRDKIKEIALNFRFQQVIINPNLKKEIIGAVRNSRLFSESLKKLLP